MSARRKFNWIEWGFVGFLAVVCGLLTSLQYQWTGEIAQAEMTRLRGNLEEQSQLLCGAFDAELSSYCRQFFVTRTELEDLGRDAACLQRLHEWQAGNPRPIFRRIAVAAYSNEQLQLFAMESETQEQLKPMEWPAHWDSLRENLERSHWKGRYPSPFVDPNGALFNFSLPTLRDRNGRSESGWLIFELDLDYARNIWLPELIRTYLNSAGRPPNDIVVKTASEPVTTLFASHVGAGQGGEKPFTVRFNRQWRSFIESRPLTGDGRWVLEARPQPGALEAIVYGSRRRNIGVALALNALIILVGVALVRHTRRSRALAEARMNFVATVSHELRTPLTVIRGAAHNLQRGVVSEPGRIEQYASVILAHAENLGEMVEQILALAAARRRGSAKREPVAIREVLTSSVAACETETRAAGCEVEMKLPDTLPDIQGDEAALRRVFQNLIINAAKHAAPGRWIGISATAVNGTEPPAVAISISDRGPGIPKEEQRAVFEPFMRGSAAREAQTRGSGLGLSLVREIVKIHGGSVTLASEPGQGATFTVKLPSP